MFKKKHNINILHRNSKQAIVEIASMSEYWNILCSYVATEKDHTVEPSWKSQFKHNDSGSVSQFVA